jgi:hypothetical protein
MKIGKYTQAETWYLFQLSLYWLIQEHVTRVLSLLYYAQDSIIQIDINNKFIPQTYAGLT